MHPKAWLLFFRIEGIRTFKKEAPFFQFLVYTYFYYGYKLYSHDRITCRGLHNPFFLPQAINTFKMKETRDISLFMYTILSAGILLWIIYSILIRDLPVIMENSTSFAIVSIILILKVKHG